MCQSIFVNRSLKLKFSQNTKKKFLKNIKISCNCFESENKKYTFCLCNLLLQIIEEFVIPVLSEFVITNSIT